MRRTMPYLLAPPRQLRTSRPARLGLALALLLALSPWSSAGGESPPRQRQFIILDQEGYSTGECLAKPGGCGQIIADSYCESQGFAAAQSYRPLQPDEVTGSIRSDRRPRQAPPLAFLIICR